MSGTEMHTITCAADLPSCNDAILDLLSTLVSLHAIDVVLQVSTQHVAVNVFCESLTRLSL